MRKEEIFDEDTKQVVEQDDSASISTVAEASVTLLNIAGGVAANHRY